MDKHELVSQLEANLHLINQTLEHVQSRLVSPFSMIDQDGRPYASDLLLAKAQTLYALSILKVYG